MTARPLVARSSHRPPATSGIGYSVLPGLATTCAPTPGASGLEAGARSTVYGPADRSRWKPGFLADGHPLGYGCGHRNEPQVRKHVRGRAPIRRVAADGEHVRPGCPRLAVVLEPVPGQRPLAGREVVLADVDVVGVGVRMHLQHDVFPGLRANAERDHVRAGITVGRKRHAQEASARFVRRVAERGGAQDDGNGRESASTGAGVGDQNSDEEGGDRQDE